MRKAYTVTWRIDDEEPQTLTFTPLGDDTDLMSTAVEHVARVTGHATDDIGLPQIEEAKA